MKTLEADCIIVGGGFGGVAAALAATDNGLKVIMTEEYEWIGGQVTSQALCALDELNAPCGEMTGFSKSYYRFKELVREYYKNNFELSDIAKRSLFLNPGNALVSTLTGEPRAALWAIEEMLKNAVAKGTLTILTQYVPAASCKEDGRIKCVEIKNVKNEEDRIKLTGNFFLDATELGDLFPLADIPFCKGAESKDETGEPHALEKTDPEAIQGFTVCQIVEFCPGENHLIQKPTYYDKFKKEFDFKLGGQNGKFISAELEWGTPFKRPFWAYRRLIDKNNFKDKSINDVYVINVSSNDYHKDHILHEDESINNKNCQTAYELSLAYFYWLQTEVPRDDGYGSGYPELKPRPDLSGKEYGLAMAPYIREGRRLKAMKTVYEQEIAWAEKTPIRADNFYDSVGLGCYYIDLHVSTNEREGHWIKSRPYQIPLRALISDSCQNMAVAGKNIGVTHITNGCYRLHPQEWAIGEAAGSLAAYCLKNNTTPQTISSSRKEIRYFQRILLERKIPLYWYSDVNCLTPGFESIQILAASEIWPGKDEHLRFEPDAPVSNFSMPEQIDGDCARGFKKAQDMGMDIDYVYKAIAWNQGIRRADAAYRLAAMLYGLDESHTPLK
jgi:FAD-dependent oxidoreductase family protein